MARGGYEAIGKRELDAETLVIPIVFGFLFGFVIVKGLVYLPSVIFAQLQWSSFLVFKFYLAALATSLLAGALISLCGDDAKRRFELSRISASNGPIAVCLGAVLLGCGLALTGTEPAAAFIQAGSGVWSGYYVILGGILAVIVYGFLHKDVFSQIDQRGRPEKNSFDDLFNCSYWHVALPLGLAVVALCYFMETEFTKHWTSEIPIGTKASDSWFPGFKASAWNVYYVGAFVGLLQIPLRTSLFCLLDSTYAYIAPVCVPLKVICDKANISLPGWFKDHSSTAGLWALFFFVSAGIGGWLSAHLGGMESFETGFGVEWCIAGGFCLVLGALIAGACPTGMAVSGCSDLNLMSFLGTAVMFGTGIALAFIFKDQDIHPEGKVSSW